MRPSVSHRLRDLRGFTLLEILIASVIGMILLGTLLYALSGGSDTGRLAAIASSLSQVRRAVKEYAADHGDVLPITESTVAGGIPIAGDAAIGAGITTQSNAAILDIPLAAERYLSKALRLAFAGDVPASGVGPDLIWDITARHFRLSPDAAPARDYSATNRLEAAIVARGTPYDFTPDGTTPLPEGRTAAFMVLPRCSEAFARKLSERIDSPRFTAAPDTADLAGSVIYQRAVNGYTTVYLYLIDL